MLINEMERTGFGVRCGNGTGLGLTFSLAERKSLVKDSSFHRHRILLRTGIQSHGVAFVNARSQGV